MESRFDKLLIISNTLIHFFAFSGLIYRSQLYSHIPVSTGEPYGLGDIIDLLFAVTVTILWCCLFISAVTLTVLNLKDNWFDSIKTLLYGTVGLTGYFYIKSSNLIF